MTALAIFLKRCNETKRDKKFAVSGILFPMVSIISILVIFYLLRPKTPELNPLLPTEFVVNNNNEVPYFWHNDTSSDSPSSLLNMFTNYDGFPDFQEFESEQQINRELLQYRDEESAIYGAYLFNNIQYEEGIYDVFFFYCHSLPSHDSSMFGEATLRQETQDTSCSIEENEQALSNAEKFSSLAFLLYGPFLIEYGFVFLIPFFSIHMVEEKEKRQKHQLLISGVSLSEYWVGNLCADYLVFSIGTSINVAILYAAQISLFVDNSFIGPLAIFSLFGVLAICSGYLLSFVFQRVETANKWLFSVMSLLSLLPYFITSLSVVLEVTPPSWMDYLLCIFPPYCLYYSMFRLSFAVFLHGGLSFSESLAFNDSGLGYIILIMMIECIVLLVAIIVLDFGLENVRNFLLKPTSPLRFSFDSELVCSEEDSIQEALRVDGIGNDDASIVIRHVWKAFKSKDKTSVFADRDISLAIPKGECFGLLGPNGAGKTTLIDMLTGLQQPNLGELYLLNTDMKYATSSLFHHVGVCQQGEVNFPLLTVYEHLLLYARIKKIPRAQMKETVEETICDMDLTDHRNKHVKQLSGGNKRKLAVAIAFMGDPKIVFLDEPSTGMDPLIRRKMWSLIEAMKQDRVIILTTHSMEEADAICERIGIMVQGSLRCIGTSQHLKNTYGNSYHVSIKCSVRKSEQVIQFMKDVCEDSKLGRNVSGNMDFELPVDSLKLGPLFQSLHTKRDELEISDYSVSQPTLEQVFLSFAKEQEQTSE